MLLQVLKAHGECILKKIQKTARAKLSAGQAEPAMPVDCSEMMMTSERPAAAAAALGLSCLMTAAIK